MRLRSVATTLAVSGLGVAALVRCNLPDVPPGPQAIPTRVAFIRGAFLSLPEQPIDHAALIASMKALSFSTVVINNVADQNGEHVADRVALAIELQSALDADVFIGTYKGSTAFDATTTTCYPGGLALTPGQGVVDKLVACSKDTSEKIAGALRAANAPSRVGCYITLQPTLVDNLDDNGVATLASLFRNSAAQCVTDGRFVGISSALAPGAGDPTKAGVIYREALTDSGVNVLMLDDGVGTYPDASPTRGAAYYQGLRNAIEDRQPAVLVWAKVEAFACTDGTCVQTHPASFDRLTRQLCAARGRVDGIMSTEYFADLAGASFVDASTSDVDAADADASDASTDDLDAAAQLRGSYLAWVDSGAPCP